MAETAPVFNADNFQPLAEPAAPAVQPAKPKFDPNNFVPSGMPNETIYSERTNETLEMPHGTLDRLGEVWGRGFDKGDAETQMGKLWFEVFIGNDTPTIRDEISRLHEESGGPIDTEWWLEEGFRATAQQIPVLKAILGKVATRAMQTGIAVGTGGLALAGVGAVPGFFSGLAVGSLEGLLEQSFILETGHLFGEISNFKDAQGNKIDPMAARITAALGGAASAGLEAMPMVLLFKLVPGSKEVLGKLGEKALKNLKIPVGKSAMLKFARNVSAIIAAETLTEGAQEVVQIAAGEVAKLTSDLDIPHINANDALDRVGNAMTEALKATPLIATGFSSPRLAVDIAENRAAKHARPNTKQEKVKDISGETIDTVTEKLRTAPVSQNLDTYDVGALDQQEREELEDAGIEIADNGTIVAEDAEMIAAESSRRTDFYQKQLGQQEKATATAESQALRKVARGRIRKIDDVVKNIDQRVDDTLTIIEERKAQGKPVKALDNRVNSLLKKRDILDAERANLLTSETPLASTRAALKATDEVVELKGAELLRAERRTAKAKERALQKGIRDGLRLAKTDVKAAQKVVMETINNSDLSQADKGKFLNAITQVQNAEQLQKTLPRLLNRIDALVTKARRKKVITKLDKVLRQTKVKKRKSKYGPQVQAVLDVARKAMALPKEAAQERFAARMATSTTEIPTPTETLENTILALKADPKSVNLRDLEGILETITQLVELGKSIRGANILAKQKASETLRTELLDLIGPERVETPEQRNRREKLTALEVNTFLGMSGAWWNKLRRVMRSSDKARVDTLTNKLSLFNESRAFDRGKANAIKRFTELLMAAMNTTSERALIKKLQRDETVELNLGAYLHSDGQVRNLEVRTRAQLRKRWMELQDPNLRESMMSEKSNAYTEEIIGVLENEMEELDFRMAEAQLEFYSEYYSRINEVYERVYGYTLPRIEFYSPVKRKTDKNEAPDEFMGSIHYRGGVSPGSLKSRQPNIRPIREIGDFTVLQSHVSEMEYFMAYAEKTQQLNNVVGHADVLQQIERVFGTEMLQTIKNDLDMFSKRGVENSIIGEKFYLTLMRNFSFAQLGAKPQIGLKQLASFAAYAEDVKSTDFLAGIAKFIANPKAALRVLNESELFSSRGMNIDRDFQAITSDKSIFNFMGKHPTLTNIIMLPIKLGDKAAIAVGGYGHYHAMLKKNGGDKAAALASVELLTVRTQQSADVDQLSELQRQNSFVRILTQFMSSANALARAEYNAILDKTAGRITRREFAKRMFVLHMLIPGVIQFVANGFTWDDEDQLRASMLGTVNGVFIIGDLFDALARMAISGEDSLHDLSNRNPFNFFPDMMVALDDFAENGVSYEDIIDGSKSIDGMAQAVGALSGIPLKTLIGELRGVYHVVDGVAHGNQDDVRRGFAEILGYSSYTIDQKLLAP